MLSLLTRCCLKRALNIVENAETVQSTALEVPVVIKSHTDDLLIRFHLLDN